MSIIKHNYSIQRSHKNISLGGIYFVLQRDLCYAFVYFGVSGINDNLTIYK